MNLTDPLLHIPLAGATIALAMIHPALGAAWHLWTREAAQEAAGDFLAGMDLRRYSLQRHLEIWPPAAIVGAISQWLLPSFWLIG